jgi:ribosomal protein RSM22 (predicted rRNA methylase)
MSPLDRLEDFLASKLLSPSAYTQYQAGDVGKEALQDYTRAIRDISHAYVAHRVGSRLPSPISTIQAAEAYALYYTPINAAKILHLVPMLHLPANLSVLDIGCGPGTAGLALLAALPQRFDLTCVENSQPMRSVAKRLLTGWQGSYPLARCTMLSTLSESAQPDYDLVIAANVLAELHEQEASQLLEKLLARVRPNGYLLILEPGQQRHTRRLMAIRDLILASSPDVVPIFPCLRSDPCPMLKASDTDWCHDTLEWRQPRLNRQFDQLLSFNKHRIKYSGFVFQRGGTLLDGVRVITPPAKTRAGVEAMLCGKDLYGIARIRKGTRSDSNRALEKASVFDRLLMSNPCIGDLPPEAAFSKSQR